MSDQRDTALPIATYPNQYQNVSAVWCLKNSVPLHYTYHRVVQLGLDKKPLKQVLVDLSRMKAAQSANNKQGDAPYVIIPRLFFSSICKL